MSAAVLSPVHVNGTSQKYGLSVIGNVFVEDHVKYIIEVASPDGDSWTVHRRYREITQLHSALRAKYGSAVADLPQRRLAGLGKWLIGPVANVDSSLVAERRAWLQSLLNDILVFDTAITTPTLQVFLGCPEVAAAAELGNEIVQKPSAILRKMLSGVLAPQPQTGGASCDASVLEFPEVMIAVATHAGATISKRLRALCRSARNVIDNIQAHLSTEANFIFVCGVSSNDRSFVVHRFHPNCGAWDELPPAVLPRTACGAASCEGQLYLLGGLDVPNTGAADTGKYICGERLDPASGAWQLLPAMDTQLTHGVAIAAGGYIYLFGGLRNGVALAIARRFSPTSETWETVASMSISRFECSAAVVIGRIYVIGGSTNQGMPLACIESYSPGTKKWSKHAPLRIPRYGCAAAAIRGRILVLGGQSEATDLLTEVELLDTRTEEWTVMPNMLAQRRRCGIAAVGSKLYVFGGGRLEVDCFDMRSHSWQELEPMPCLLSFCAAVVGTNSKSISHTSIYLSTRDDTIQMASFYEVAPRTNLPQLCRLYFSSALVQLQSSSAQRP